MQYIINIEVDYASPNLGTYPCLGSFPYRMRDRKRSIVNVLCFIWVDVLPRFHRRHYFNLEMSIAIGPELGDKFDSKQYFIKRKLSFARCTRTSKAQICISLPRKYSIVIHPLFNKDFPEYLLSDGAISMLLVFMSVWLLGYLQMAALHKNYYLAYKCASLSIQKSVSGST